MKSAIIAILLIFLSINLGVMAFAHSDMGGGHSSLCGSFLAGICPSAENGKEMFASHYLSLLHLLSNAFIATIAAIAFLILFFLFQIFCTFSLKIAFANIFKRNKLGFLRPRKFWRWIALHNKGDNTIYPGLLAYSGA